VGGYFNDNLQLDQQSTNSRWGGFKDLTIHPLTWGRIPESVASGVGGSPRASVLTGTPAALTLSFLWFRN